MRQVCLDSREELLSVLLLSPGHLVARMRRCIYKKHRSTVQFTWELNSAGLRPPGTVSPYSRQTRGSGVCSLLSPHPPFSPRSDGKASLHSAVGKALLSMGMTSRAESRAPSGARVLG